MGSVPRNTIHYVKKTKGDYQVLKFYSPAGFEKVRVGTAVPAEVRTLLPKGFDKQTYVQRIQLIPEQLLDSTAGNVVSCPVIVQELT